MSRGSSARLRVLATLFPRAADLAADELGRGLTCGGGGGGGETVTVGSRSEGAHRGRTRGHGGGGVAHLPRGGEENGVARTNARTNPRRARRRIVGRSARDTGALVEARAPIEDEAILFILSAPLGIEPRSPRPQRGIRAPRDQDQGPLLAASHRHARAWRASRGFERLVEATLAVPRGDRGRPADHPTARPPRSERPPRPTSPRWGTPPPTRAAIPTRRPAAPPRATGRHANAEGAQAQAQVQEGAQIGQEARARRRRRRPTVRARAPRTPVVRPSRSPARARRRNTRVFVIEHPKRLLSPSLLTDSSPLLSPPTSQTREGKTPRGETFPQTPTEGPARRAHSLRRRRRRRRMTRLAPRVRARKTFRSRRRPTPRRSPRLRSPREKSPPRAALSKRMRPSRGSARRARSSRFARTLEPRRRRRRRRRRLHTSAAGRLSTRRGGRWRSWRRGDRTRGVD